MRTRGFTLIEVMIVVSIIALMLVLGMPGMTAWLQNVKVRSTAESIYNGILLARMEGMRRNARASFWLVSRLDDGCALSARGGSWIVTAGSTASPAGACASSAGKVQVGAPQPGGSSVTVTADHLCISFDGLGQVRRDTSVAEDCRTPLTKIEIRSPAAHTVQLDIRIDGSQARLCYPDPDSLLDPTDSRKC